MALEEVGNTLVEVRAEANGVERHVLSSHLQLGQEDLRRNLCSLTIDVSKLCCLGILHSAFKQGDCSIDIILCKKLICFEDGIVLCVDGEATCQGQGHRTKCLSHVVSYLGLFELVLAFSGRHLLIIEGGLRSFGVLNLDFRVFFLFGVYLADTTDGISAFGEVDKLHTLGGAAHHANGGEAQTNGDAALVDNHQVVVVGHGLDGYHLARFLC